MFPNSRRERELADELAVHLEMHTEDNLRAGMSPEMARREAFLKLGGLESTKQAYRERQTIPSFENVLRDVHFALRQLRKNLGFSTTAILTLGLGMCASVAIFAFVDAALIKPLPYPEPGRLVGVFEKVPMFPRSPLSYPDYLDWKRMNTVFRSLDVFVHSRFMLRTETGTEAATGTRVSAGFLHTLGVKPVIGRDFYAGEDAPTAARAVILSYSAWQKRYGGRPDILGTKISWNGEPNIVIGVLPREFYFAPAEPTEFWSALHATTAKDLRRSFHSLSGVARLKDGVSVQTAEAEMKSIAKRLEKLYPGDNRGQGAAVMPLSEVIVGHIRPILLMLLSGAGLLLLIACVNVASLLLVRSESRRREMAVRSALGAGKIRLMSQFTTEGLVLVVAGTGLGLAFAYWVMQLLLRLIPAQMLAGMPYLHGLGLNHRVILYSGLIALMAMVLFSITPILHFSLSNTLNGLVEGSRGSAGNTWRRLGSKLVIIELATAMVLLTAGGLLGKSFYRLLHVDLGMQPEHLEALEVAASPATYKSDKQAIALGTRLVSEISALPSVKAVGIATELPLSGNGNTDWIRFEGRPYHGEHNEVNEREVSAGYLQTIGAKLLRGRYFTDAEDESKPRVVIINQALARKYFPGEDPIGKRIGNGDLAPESMKEIIGIVDDVREGELDAEVWPAVYYAFNQSPEIYFSIAVRISQAEPSLIPILIATVHKVDRDIVTSPGASMTELIHNTPSAYLHRSSTWLVGGFAGLALLLGVVGLYGVVAYSVSQRTREIGIRMALGAHTNSVCRLILQEAGALIASGVVIGVVCSIGGAILLRGLLFGVHYWDLPTLLAVAAVLSICTLLASYLPARRAAAVNPLDALRAE